ncbi:MAG: hypothetical protein P8P74_08610 [Crocinitomicaceae bacterium]|nr:hypothetical protein [Crocinitomicaceae bacterium]
MKKVIICSFLSLFIGGMANAATEVNANQSTVLSKTSPKVNNEIIGSGVDEGGAFIIVSTENQCVKIYLNMTGQFD